jgi:hypothetical protein
MYKRKKVKHLISTARSLMVRMHDHLIYTMSKNQRNNHEKNNREINTNETPIYTSDNSTLQSPSEHEHDASVDPGKNDRIDVSNDDLRETKADRLAGSDRAGSAERKDNQL